MKVLYTDHGFASIATEKQIIEAAGATLQVAQCKTAEALLPLAQDADALLVQWAPVTAAVIASLERCKVIVRIGIGVDNVDVAAATARGISVCNVPDYCLEEVADHTVALALALIRQLPFIDRRLRAGVWKITPSAPMPALRDLTFATVGFGRIARLAHQRMQTFGCRSLAHDPGIDSATIEAAGVEPVELDAIFRRGDIVSLHCPLTAATQHLVSSARLQTMKATAILINTARGGLIDGHALAKGLDAGTIAAAGLDVFDHEPLPAGHPLRTCDRALLTSHVAWYSERSVPALQHKAAEEIVRALRGEPLRNQINPQKG